MAFEPATLQANLLAIFLAMNAMSEDGDGYCATEMADAIKTFILTGIVNTTDTGAATAGSYAGAGVGTMTIDKDSLMDDLFTTFTAGYTNDGIADHMANDIDNACKEDNTVVTVSSGTVTSSLGVTSPFSGPGKGKFSGDKSIISIALKACFTAMNGMSAGGNELYALQLATAVNSYLTGGNINVDLQAPFLSGSGKGKIA
jgi:hypothetical protein